MLIPRENFQPSRALLYCSSAIPLGPFWKTWLTLIVHPNTSAHLHIPTIFPGAQGKFSQSFPGGRGKKFRYFSPAVGAKVRCLGLRSKVKYKSTIFVEPGPRAVRSVPGIRWCWIDREAERTCLCSSEGALRRRLGHLVYHHSLPAFPLGDGC